jgi:hypothetical protein
MKKKGDERILIGGDELFGVIKRMRALGIEEDYTVYILFATCGSLLLERFGTKGFNELVAEIKSKSKGKGPLRLPLQEKKGK